jgi:hypothetical protein
MTIILSTFILSVAARRDARASRRFVGFVL